jgi:glycine cleavage system H protein
MNVPAGLKYTKTHEWVRVEGAEVVIGLTDHAQAELGDIVFVEVPGVGASLKAEDGFGTVESVKTVSDMYAPIAGDITAVNEALATNSELLNKDPYGDGWIVRMKPANPAEVEALLDAAAYQRILEES